MPFQVIEEWGYGEWISILWLVLCIGLVVEWIRSYFNYSPPWSTHDPSLEDLALYRGPDPMDLPVEYHDDVLLDEVSSLYRDAYPDAGEILSQPCETQTRNNDIVTEAHMRWRRASTLHAVGKTAEALELLGDCTIARDAA